MELGHQKGELSHPATKADAKGKQKDSSSLQAGTQPMESRWLLVCQSFPNFLSLPIKSFFLPCTWLTTVMDPELQLSADP